MDSTEESRKPTLMPMWALEQLLTADTWEKKRRVLEEQWEFLVTTRDATDILDVLSKQMETRQTGNEDEWIAQGAYLLFYRGLLVNARVSGIEHAWSAFMMQMSMSQL